eukprot:1033820_1
MGNKFICNSFANSFANSNKTDSSSSMPRIAQDAIPNPGVRRSRACASIDIKSFIHESMTIHNGITGKYISQRLVSISTSFWIAHIEPLPVEDKLEIGATLLFGMIASNKGVNRLFSSNTYLKQNFTKMLDMIGHLMRRLIGNDADLQSTLHKLGVLHQKIGVQRHHYDIMIQSLHEAMSYYFPKQYNINVRYAMDQVILMCAKIMTQQNTMYKNHLRVRSFHGANTDFLASLETCLASAIGREYFHSYLKNQSSHEISVYLQLMQKFKDQQSNQDRYVVAKELMQYCIVSDGDFAINVSYETRKNVLDKLHTLPTLPTGPDYFTEVEVEMRRLIIKNYWFQFVESIASMRNSVSFDVDV